MLFKADLDCVFAVDDQANQSLKAGEIKRISATVGEHLITAVTLDGRDRWETVVALDKPVQKVVLIELVKVRAARQVAERQVAQLQQEIAAKEQKAKDVSAATRALGEQQEEVKKQRREIEDQIDELSKQMRKEEAAAQADDASARQGQVVAGTAAAQGTKLGNFAATLNDLASSSAVDSAAEHRAKARELQDQILDLNRKLELLSGGKAAPMPVAESLNASAGVPGAPSAPGTPPVPDAGSLYSQGLSYYDGGQYDLSIQAFTDYLKYYKDTDRASNAQFYIGECYYSQQDYKHAIEAYDACSEKYPAGNKAAAAQLKKGFSLLVLNEKTAGIRELRSLVQRFPDSHEADLARQRLKRLGITVPAATHKKSA